jgi:hypothetical protein
VVVSGHGAPALRRRAAVLIAIAGGFTFVAESVVLLTILLLKSTMQCARSATISGNAQTSVVAAYFLLGGLRG